MLPGTSGTCGTLLDVMMDQPDSDRLVSRSFALAYPFDLDNLILLDSQLHLGALLVAIRGKRLVERHFLLVLANLDLGVLVDVVGLVLVVDLDRELATVVLDEDGRDLLCKDCADADDQRHKRGQELAVHPSVLLVMCT